MARWPSGPLPPPATERPRSSSEIAELYLRHLIFDGHLRPGTRVPQDDVAAALGLSRMPVREALIALEREGWVTLEHHRGAFVCAFDEQDVRDHYALYGLMLGFAADRATTRGGPDLAVRLQALVRDLQVAEDADDCERLVKAFHAEILEAARSPRTRTVLRAMPTLVPGNFMAQVPGAADAQRRDLAAIARAVRAGDGDKAAAGYGRLMRRHGDQVVEVLASRGLFASGLNAGSGF
ncbi:MAG: GntR family transcriptional regulator [Acidimicrobiales bacterium]|nr:GntR family transcriptional regulator [Acidimicrobiales bacterium]